jgi:hypothetical protein
VNYSGIFLGCRFLMLQLAVRKNGLKHFLFLKNRLQINKEEKEKNRNKPATRLLKDWGQRRIWLNKMTEK